MLDRIANRRVQLQGFRSGRVCRDCLSNMIDAPCEFDKLVGIWQLSCCVLKMKIYSTHICRSRLPSLMFLRKHLGELCLSTSSILLATHIICSNLSYGSIASLIGGFSFMGFGMAGSVEIVCRIRIWCTLWIWQAGRNLTIELLCA